MTVETYNYLFFALIGAYFVAILSVLIYGVHLTKRLAEIQEAEKQRRYEHHRNSACDHDHDHERPRGEGRGRHRKGGHRNHNEQIPTSPLLGVVQPPTRPRERD